MQCFSAVKDAAQQQAAATDRKLQSQQIPMLPVPAYDNPHKNQSANSLFQTTIALSNNRASPMGQATLSLHPPSGYYLSTTQEACATKVDQLLPSALITLGSKGCCFFLN